MEKVNKSIEAPSVKRSTPNPVYVKILSTYNFIKFHPLVIEIEQSQKNGNTQSDIFQK